MAAKERAVLGTLRPAQVRGCTLELTVDGMWLIRRAPVAQRAASGRCRVWRVDVPGAAESIPLLRKWVRSLLTEDAELAEAFELIVSEYGTNALQHTASGAPGGVIRAEFYLGTHRARLIVTATTQQPMFVSVVAAEPACTAAGRLPS